MFVEKKELCIKYLQWRFDEVKTRLASLKIKALNCKERKEVRKLFLKMESLVANLIIDLNIHVICNDKSIINDKSDTTNKGNNHEYNKLWKTIIEPLQDQNYRFYERLRDKFEIR